MPGFLVHEPAVDGRHSPQGRRREARTHLRPLGQAPRYSATAVSGVPDCLSSYATDCGTSGQIRQRDRSLTSRGIEIPASRADTQLSEGSALHCN